MASWCGRRLKASLAIREKWKARSVFCSPLWDTRNIGGRFLYVCSEEEKIMTKVLLTFFLGLFSFLVSFFAGKISGLPALYAARSAYFFMCQFFLSWNHPDAHRKDWR